MGRVVAGHGSGPGERRVDCRAKDMPEEDVHFLNARGLVARYDQTVVSQAFRRNPPPLSAGQAGRYEACQTSNLQGRHDIRRVARGRHPDQQVARPPKGLDLPREHRLEAEIVAPRGDCGRVGREGDRRQGAPLLLEPDRQFRGDVLAIGGAAPVPAEDELAPGLEHRYSRCGQDGRRLEKVARAVEQGDMIGIQPLEPCEVGRTPVHAGTGAPERVRKTVRISMDASVIDRLANANVLVVGDVLLDRYIDGKVSRVSPEAPVPVLRYGAARALLGGAGNVAANLLSYGASVTLVGVTGVDPPADELRRLCASFPGLQTVFVVDPERPTTVKTRYLSGWHQLLRVDAEDVLPLADHLADRVIAAAREAMVTTRVLILSDYAKGVLDPKTVAVLIDDARKAGIKVVVDPKKSNAAVFAGATLITPNTEEMAQLSGIRIDSDAAAEAACRHVLDRVAVDAILVTRGEAGMTLYERNGTIVHVAAETHRVFDVTGAGDTVIATLAAALAAGEPLPSAVQIANTAAGIVVTKPGTAVVHPGELRRALGGSGTVGVAQRTEAAEQARLWRDQGLRIGFTNGCFDLLHRGHLYSLEQAARRVDRLVVGINSDASAGRLKGPGRPVQDVETRGAVLAALRFVDLVVPFDEDTPGGLIEAIRPDLLFKGADYADKEVVGSDFVLANGGRVELLPLLPGHSTTGTVRRMKETTEPGGTAPA